MSKDYFPRSWTQGPCSIANYLSSTSIGTTIQLCIYTSRKCEFSTLNGWILRRSRVVVSPQGRKLFWLSTVYTSRKCELDQYPNTLGIKSCGSYHPKEGSSYWKSTQLGSYHQMNGLARDIYFIGLRWSFPGSHVPCTCWYTFWSCSQLPLLRSSESSFLLMNCLWKL